MRLIDADELIPLIKMGECNMYDEYCQGRNGGIAFAVERIKQMPTIERKTETPCDLCRHNPPSSGDGKPCSYCPAEQI